MLLNCGVGEDPLESLGLQGDPTSPFKVLNIHWKDWCLSWSSNTSATWCEEWTPWKRPWCWERWKAGGEGDDTGWNAWMVSLTQWTWVWANSGRWWRIGKPAVLQCMRSQRVRHDWATEQQLVQMLISFRITLTDTLRKILTRSGHYGVILTKNEPPQKALVYLGKFWFYGYWMKPRNYIFK